MRKKCLKKYTAAILCMLLICGSVPVYGAEELAEEVQLQEMTEAAEEAAEEAAPEDTPQETEPAAAPESTEEAAPENIAQETDPAAAPESAAQETDPAQAPESGEETTPEDTAQEEEPAAAPENTEEAAPESSAQETEPAQDPESTEETAPEADASDSQTQESEGEAADEETPEEETLLTQQDDPSWLTDPISVNTSKLYTLQSAIDRSFVIDIYGGRTANKTKVWLYKANDSEAQQFRFRSNGDGTYSIINPKSGKALDVPGNSQNNGVQLDIYTDNKTAAQKFKIYRNSDGTVTFQNAGSGKVIDIYGGKAVNKNPVQMYKANNTKAQKFYMAEVSEPVEEDFSGTYVIKTALSSSKAVDIYGGRTTNKANVQLWTANGTAAQIFRIVKSGSYYLVRNSKSGKVLDVAGGKNAKGTNVWQYTSNGSNAQLWKIVRNSDGTVSFYSKINTNLALDVYGGRTANKTNIQVYTKNGTKAQKFNLVKTSAPGGTASSQKNLEVLTNIIGAVESGGQVYGKRNYEAYEDPYANTSAEHTITLGWAQYYGSEAYQLVSLIFDMDNAAFRAIDTDGSIEEKLAVNNWVAEKWAPTSAQKQTLIKLISSPNGKKAQDQLFMNLMKTYIEDCENTYTSEVPAVMMYCEIRHLNPSGAKRIFDRCNGDYSLDSIMASLKKDQSDTSSNNQVGDSLYQSRHDKCREFIEKYADY